MEKQICALKGSKKVTEPGMDRLGTMVFDQARFAKGYFNVMKLSQIERERWIKEMCLCLAVEVVELLDNVNWKHWKKRQKDMDLEQARFEVADLMCFIFNTAMLLGMDAESLFQYTMRKQEINRERQAMQY